MIRIMIDLETMSTERTAAIISIGAVQFGHGIPVDHADAFYQRILPESAAMHGHVDKSTMEWWDKQDPAVRAETFGGTMQPGRVLEMFDAWLEGICQRTGTPLDQVELWARGADFDLPILQHLYEQIQGNYPFNFRKHMCERTVRNLVPPECLSIAESERTPGTKHSAIQDALNQAHYMNHALAWLGIRG